MVNPRPTVYFLTCELFKKDVLAGLSPLPEGEPEIRIYEMA